MDTAQLIQELQQIQAELKKVQQINDSIAKIQEQIRALENNVSFLYNLKEIKCGDGDLSFRLDKNGLWLGKRLWADVSSGVPEGTGIGMDGTFYGKGGVTGVVSIPEGGGSFSVQNGLVTSL